MNQLEFNKVVDETVSAVQQLLVVKGGEYAGSEDRLSNFKRGAELTGCHPLQVLFVYLSKHYDAVATYVRDQSSGTARPRSEPIEGRLDDIINYCILAKALIADTRPSTAAAGGYIVRGEPWPAPAPTPKVAVLSGAWADEVAVPDRINREPSRGFGPVRGDGAVLSDSLRQALHTP